MPFVYRNSMTLLHSASKSSSSSTGHVGAMVIQNPRYLVTGLGKPVTLSCSQDMHPNTVNWFYEGDFITEKGEKAFNELLS